MAGRIRIGKATMAFVSLHHLSVMCVWACRFAMQKGGDTQFSNLESTTQGVLLCFLMLCLGLNTSINWLAPKSSRKSRGTKRNKRNTGNKIGIFCCVEKLLHPTSVFLLVPACPACLCLSLDEKVETQNAGWRDNTARARDKNYLDVQADSCAQPNL